MNLHTRTRHRMLAVLLCAFPVIAPAGGKEDYEAMCSACHGFGVAGAPELGDREAWATRTSKSRDLIYLNAIEGFTGASGVMPAKGGFPELDDQRIRAIVDYMIEAAQ